MSVIAAEQTAPAEATEPKSALASTVVRFWRTTTPLLLVALDAVIVFAAVMVSYFLRFYIELFAIKSVPVGGLESYIRGAAILAGLWLYSNWRAGAYESGLHGIGTPLQRVRVLLSSAAQALVVLMVLSFMYRPLLLSRQVYLMTGVIGFAGMLASRMLLDSVGRRLAWRGASQQSILFMGADKRLKPFIKRLRHVKAPFRMNGLVLRNGGESNGRRTFAGQPILGGLADLPDIYRRKPFDILVMPPSSDGSADGPGHDFLRVLNFCEARDIALYTLPDAFDVAVSQREVGVFSGMPLIRICDAAIHPGYAATKRAFDVVAASSLLLFGLPLFVAIAFIVKMTSKGGAFFIQPRAGLHGHPFKMYKFRSMFEDAEERLKELVDFDALKEPVFKIENDPRVTKVGRYLRRASLDELPQLFNVLKGEMSLVGPRPEEVKLVAKYNEWQKRRLKAKPGITGFQQITNRGEPDLSERVKLDLIYLKHQGLLLDAFILAKTLAVVVSGGGQH